MEKLTSLIKISNAPLNILFDILSNIVKHRDMGLHNHMLEAGTLALKLWNNLGLDEGFDAFFGGYVHDIGKIDLPKGLLWKPASLNEDDWILMKKHPEIGASYFNSIENLRPYEEVILCHHERPDGSGYPRGLKNKDIPLASKIVSVADMFSSMRSPRTYRPAHSMEATILIIERDWRDGFDEDIFNKIKDILYSV